MATSLMSCDQGYSNADVFDYSKVCHEDLVVLILHSIVLGLHALLAIFCFAHMCRFRYVWMELFTNLAQVHVSTLVMLGVFTNGKNNLDATIEQSIQKSILNLRSNG